MKQILLSFLFVAIAGALLVREQENGTFSSLDDRTLTAMEMVYKKHLPDKPLITMVRHNEQSADISGSSQLMDVDIALFLRTVFKFSPLSVGIAGDLSGKGHNNLITEILEMQTSHHSGIYFGMLFSSETSNYTPQFRTFKDNLPAIENPLFRFAGFPASVELPHNAIVGFLNVEENTSRKNLIPLIARYHDMPLPSFALAGILASKTPMNAIAQKINEQGLLKIRENTQSLIESITLDELLLEMEKSELGRGNEKLESLFSGRMILLGKDSEADQTILLASGKKYSPLHVQAIALASLLANNSPREIPSYWSMTLLLPLLFCILLLRRVRWIGRVFIFLILLLLVSGTIAGLYGCLNIWLPPLPALGMIIGLMIAAFFLSNSVTPSLAATETDPSK